MLGCIDLAPGLSEMHGRDKATVGEGVAKLDTVLAHSVLDAIYAEYNIGVVCSAVSEVHAVGLEVLQ